MIHRENLVFKHIDNELREVLNSVISMVNLVKKRALNTRLFKNICQEMGSVHETVLYHTEVRSLSRGKVLKRIVELSDELRLFFLILSRIYLPILTMRNGCVTLHISLIYLKK